MTSFAYQVEEFRKVVEQDKAEKDLLCSQKEDLIKSVELFKKNINKSIKARWVLSEVSKITQQKFTEYVEKLVTMAIQSVFDRPFNFLVISEIKRNKSECMLRVYEGYSTDRQEMIDNSFLPEDEMGGGLLDVISFALRTVMWSIEKPRSRSILLLDEPMKFVGKGELMNKAIRMMYSVSHKLGIQLIVNTHEPEIAEIADKAWMVEYDGKKSHINLIQGEEEIKKIKLRRKI